MKNNSYTMPVTLKMGSVLLMAVLFAACSGKNSDDNTGNLTHPTNGGITVGTGTPVETGTKVGIGQTPAFEGQTRIGSVKITTAIKVSIITSSLSYPWGLAFLPDGRMMVTEKPGRIRIVTATGAVGNPITGVPAVVYQAESGLLGLAIDPDFGNSRLVFWTFVEQVSGGVTVSVARGKLSADETAFENVQVIYRATPAYNISYTHKGSQLLFDNEGLLYVSFGEHFNDDIRVQAQSLSASIGKIIRINKDGTAAAGNPFANTAGARPEIWSLGHRNPQGLAFNPVTGDLWESEHGPQAGDEINLIKAGANYGWPVIAYGLEYSGAKVGSGNQQQAGMEQPVYYWDPAIAPSGITFYTGSLIPEWKNNLFVAALKGMHIVRLVIDNNKVVGEERLLTDQGQRFRKVVQGPDGALYAITDMAQGRIYRIGI